MLKNKVHFKKALKCISLYSRHLRIRLDKKQMHHQS